MAGLEHVQCTGNRLIAQRGDRVGDTLTGGGDKAVHVRVTVSVTSPRSNAEMEAVRLCTHASARLPVSGQHLLARPVPSIMAATCNVPQTK